MATVYKLKTFVSYVLLVIILTQFPVSSSKRNSLGSVDRQEPSKEDKNQLISRLLKHKDANVRLLAARILNSTKDKLEKNSESESFEFADKNEIVSIDQQVYQDEEKYTKDATPSDKTVNSYKKTGDNEIQSDVKDEAFHGTKSEAGNVEVEKEDVNLNLQREIPHKDISYTKNKNIIEEHTNSHELLSENIADQVVSKITNKDSHQTDTNNEKKRNKLDEKEKDNNFGKDDIQSSENENKHAIKELSSQGSSEQNKLQDMTQNNPSTNLVEKDEEAPLQEEEKQDLTPVEQTKDMSTKEQEHYLPNEIESQDSKTITDKMSKTITKEAPKESQQKDNELLENIDMEDKIEQKNEASAEEQVYKDKHAKDQLYSNSFEQNEEGIERKGDENDIKETSGKAFREENLETEDNEENTDKNSMNNPKEESPKLKENSRQQQEDYQQSFSRNPTTKTVSLQKDIELLKEHDLNTNTKTQTKEITTTKVTGHLSSEHRDRDKLKGIKTDLRFDSRHTQFETTTKAGASFVETTSIKQKLNSVLNTKSSNIILSSTTSTTSLTNKVKTTVTNSKAALTSSVQTPTQAVFISRIQDDTAKVVESEQKKETCLPDGDDLYRKSALVSAAIGGAFIGGFLVLAVFYCKMKFSRYYKGSYQRVPVEYDFELNPRLKTHNR